MAESPYLTGSHVSPSPSGLLLACLVDKTLRISYTKAPEQCIDFLTWAVPNKVRYLKWAPDSSRVLIFTSQHIEVVNLEDDKDRARIENGTGGLGRFESAGFLGPDSIFTVWEYGRAKVWHLVTGHTRDIEDVKTLTTGRNWAPRPVDKGHHTVAYLSRPAADDMLVLSDAGSTSLPPSKIPSTDAQSLTWSPDGMWLAVLDAPQYSPGLHLLTADGNHFRSYPPKDRTDSDSVGLGIKSVTWSADSQSLAVSRFDAHLDLLSARTLSSIATVEHSIIIDQNNVAASQQVTIWQENVAASGARSYNATPQPVSPPLTSSKSSDDPRSTGVVIALFSEDGRYLATIDQRMLSTVWIWDVQRLHSRSVLIQHNNVRKIQWHDTISDLLLLDCSENVVYLYSVGSADEPQTLNVSSAVQLTLTFLPSHSTAIRPAVLAASKEGFKIVYPHGRDGTSGTEDDSIFEALSGNHNSSVADLSHTQRLEYEANYGEATARLDDTFQIKGRAADMRDPLDDSDIF